MDIIDFLSDLLSLVIDGVGNLIAFIKSVPDVFNSVYTIIPAPFQAIIAVFIPLFVIAIFYKFVRGY